MQLLVNADQTPPTSSPSLGRSLFFFFLCCSVFLNLKNKNMLKNNHCNLKKNTVFEMKKVKSHGRFTFFFFSLTWVSEPVCAHLD